MLPDLPEDPTSAATEPAAEVTLQVTRADGTVEPAETVYSDNHPHNQEIE